MSDIKGFKKFIDSKADKELHPALHGQIIKLIKEYENENLIKLLKDSLKEFTNLTVADGNYFDLQYPDMIERLANMITEIEEGEE